MGGKYLANTSLTAEVRLRIFIELTVDFISIERSLIKNQRKLICERDNVPYKMYVNKTHLSYRLCAKDAAVFFKL